MLQLGHTKSLATVAPSSLVLGMEAALSPNEGRCGTLAISAMGQIGQSEAIHSLPRRGRAWW
jgi:hypothetical protein